MLRSRNARIAFSALALLFVWTTSPAQEEKAPEPASTVMSNERLSQIIVKLDENAKGRSGFWEIEIRERKVLIITDERADRMRIITGIAPATELDEAVMRRMLQANFDSALDARYALAKEVLWSAFIHPLSPLDERSFVSGVAQVVTLAESYGSTFSSGGLTFGGGDSAGLIQELLDRANAI